MAGSSSGETAAQLRAQTVVSATSSVLSIIGAFYILGRYWYARHLKKKSLSVYAASAHNLDVTKELIHVLAYLVRLFVCYISLLFAWKCLSRFVYGGRTCLAPLDERLGCCPPRRSTRTEETPSRASASYRRLVRNWRFAELGFGDWGLMCYFAACSHYVWGWGADRVEFRHGVEPVQVGLSR